jgi:hypothetical protein
LISSLVNVFNFDFGFMCASLQSLIKIIGATQVVNSCDGYNSVLITNDDKTRYTWVFLTETKEPPTLLVHTFFNPNGLKTDYCALCIDQGDEVWLSDSLWLISATAG